MANALKNIMVIKVTMNGGISSFATEIPLMNPMRIPATNIRNTATGTAQGLPARRPPSLVRIDPHNGLLLNKRGLKSVVITDAPITLHVAIIEGWDKSIPATMSTNVWPMATASNGQKFDVIFLKFENLMRSGMIGTITTKYAIVR